jgi:hypothetical protein
MITKTLMMLWWVSWYHAYLALIQKHNQHDESAMAKV